MVVFPFGFRLAPVTAVASAGVYAPGRPGDADVCLRTQGRNGLKWIGKRYPRTKMVSF
jgi:hypothetical protein